MFVQLQLYALKSIPHAKYGKNLLVMPVFLKFFYNIRHYLAHILPRDHTHCYVGFQWFMLVDSINVNNFNCNPIILKNILVKPLTITIFGHNLRKKGVTIGHAQNEKQFFTEKNKPGHKLSKKNYFIKISYVLAQLWMFSYFVWFFLLLKRVISSHNSCESKNYLKNHFENHFTNCFYNHWKSLSVAKS